MSELVPIKDRKWRKEIPDKHRATLDTRVQWLWNQRFGVVQTVYNESTDILDVTAATLILQGIMAKDLVSIRQIFQRLEGGSSFDDDIIDATEETLRI